MAAKIIDKRFDAPAGALVVTIQDDLGVHRVHTLHVLELDGSEAEVAGHIHAALAQADDRAARIAAAFAKHGWSR